MLVPIKATNYQENVGELDLPSEIFDTPLRHDIISLVIRWQAMNARVGSANTKTVSEIRRTGAKIYQQKGGGRARHGSKKVNTFVGGAVTFGPRPIHRRLSVNKKIRRLALRSALSYKLSQNQLYFTENFERATISTQEAHKDTLTIDAKTILFVGKKEESENYFKSIRNLKGVNFIDIDGLNVRDVIRHEKIVIDASILETLNNKVRK